MLAKFFKLEESTKCGDQRAFVTAWDQQPTLLMNQNLAGPAYIGRHHGNACGHRFKDNMRQPFVARIQNEHIRGA